MTTHDDLLDLAMSSQQDAINHEIRLARKKAKDTQKASGKCLYCDEPVGPGRRFCDSDCAEDAERYGIV